MTQLESARKGKLTAEMKRVAKQEGISQRKLLNAVKRGIVVIPANEKHRNLKPIGIGEQLRTKVNANIGTSPNDKSLAKEKKKLKVALAAGTDTVMDLSIGGNINKIRRELLKACPVPFGTVPIYQAVVGKNLVSLGEGDFLRAIETHIKDGADFITVHSGVRRRAIPLVKKREMGAVSRGGSFLLKWMEHNGRENPLYENFDYILDMAHEYDCTLSLGDGLRPGCIADATDRAQLSELRTLGELQKRAFKRGVQCMIEGPGHIPLNQIKRNVELEKKYCSNAPFYCLGPVVTDVAPGYDHITCSIGGALGAYYGINFICYVTPAEHLKLPGIEDVREGVIAARIAAHAADVGRGMPKALEWDKKMAKYRKKLDWNGMIKTALDCGKASQYRKSSKMKTDACSMCGRYCALKVMK